MNQFLLFWLNTTKPEEMAHQIGRDVSPRISVSVSNLPATRVAFVVTNSCASRAQVLGVTSRELIPRGTRFGPLAGECYSNETLQKDVNRKYFWRVSRFYVRF